MRNWKHNWVGWSLALLCVAALVAIFWMLVAHNIELQNRLNRAESAVKELVVQNRGPQGPEGDPGAPGRGPTDAEIADAVEAYCAANNGCAGPQGVAGKPGAPGASGSPGAPGSNGSSITKIVCERTSLGFYSGSTRIGGVSMVCIP